MSLQMASSEMSEDVFNLHERISFFLMHLIAHYTSVSLSLALQTLPKLPLPIFLVNLYLSRMLLSSSVSLLNSLSKLYSEQEPPFVEARLSHETPVTPRFFLVQHLVPWWQIDMNLSLPFKLIIYSPCFYYSHVFFLFPAKSPAETLLDACGCPMYPLNS